MKTLTLTANLTLAPNQHPLEFGSMILADVVPGQRIRTSKLWRTNPIGRKSHTYIYMCVCILVFSNKIQGSEKSVMFPSVDYITDP